MDAQSVMPVWRSLLFVPANVDRFVEKAHTRGADAVVLDLEDGVAASEKENARSQIMKAAETVSQGTCDVLVRINRPWRMALKDLEATICPAVQALTLPKVDTPEQVQILSEITSELEEERGMVVGATKFFVSIETLTGYLRLPEVAAADGRVVALGLGAGDFCLSTGMIAEPDELLNPNLQVLIAARAAGCVPLGLLTTIDDYTDLDRFRNIARRSRRLGFEGSPCVHPDQVKILNEEFSPTEEELSRARRVIAAFEEAYATGTGAITVDGKMVDAPVVQGARAILNRHEAIQKRDPRLAAT
ncbi:MAG: CoA ester lyase [Anaerolineae bacterium]|nr:CoA ester lyase [Anaerolineae bacterium]